MRGREEVSEIDALSGGSISRIPLSGIICRRQRRGQKGTLVGWNGITYFLLKSSPY